MNNQSYFQANDTQFYIIGAIILIVAIRHFKFAAVTLAIFMVSAWLTTGKKSCLLSEDILSFLLIFHRHNRIHK